MRIRNVAITGALALGLVACDPNAPIQDPVSGLRDDVRHIPEKTKRVKEKRYDSKCLRISRAERRRKGIVCKKPWYETVTKVVRAEAWCVELDDVNGAIEEDDLWYATTQALYLKAVGLSEGDPIKFKPVHGGCW